MSEYISKQADKYEQLKKNLKHLAEQYDGIMSATLGAARLAIIDLQEASDQGEVQLRPEVKWFAEQMELVLRANHPIGGWAHMDYDALMQRLSEEVEELYELQGTEATNEFVIREAADVANFAMMIADLIRRSSSPQSEKGEETDAIKK